MPAHYELRYWWNGIRRCDVYLEEHQALAAQRQLQTTLRAGAIDFISVTSSRDMEKYYRELRKAKPLESEAREAEGGTL